MMSAMERVLTSDGCSLAADWVAPEAPCGVVVVASAMGTIVSRGMLGNYRAYNPPPLEMLGSGWELGHYILMGIFVGLASAFFILAMRAGEKGCDKVPLPTWAKPALGFGLVGVIGIGFPHVFGNGYDTVILVLREQIPLELILVLPFLKVLATTLTLGSGGTGGVFTWWRSTSTGVRPGKTFCPVSSQ